MKETQDENRGGIAYVKPEFLKVKQIDEVNADASVKTEETENRDRSEGNSDRNKRKGNKDDKKRKRGQNKDRKISHSVDKIKLCQYINKGEPCQVGDNCKFSHDIEEFLKVKGEDLGEVCVHFNLSGECPYGYSCRFLKHHLGEDNKLIIAKKEGYVNPTRNIINNTTLIEFKKDNYDSSRSKVALEKLNEEKDLIAKQELAKMKKNRELKSDDDQVENIKADQPIKNEEEIKESLDTTNQSLRKDNESVEALVESDKLDKEMESTAVVVEPTVQDNKANVTENPRDEYVETPLNLREKKLIDFRNKTYLAPLTTVGNLPFRRICKGYGVDITCGEMAMATNLLQGQRPEWSLLRRHESEDIFGVQLAGNKPESLVKCADLINQAVDVDFVDINLGCPIDMVFDNGGGSALMGSPGKLGRIVRGMNEVLDCPLTVKFRTSIDGKKLLADKLVSKFQNWGCALGTLHGRSRQQRYTKTCDWHYIQECSQLVKTQASTSGHGMAFFGNGDVLNYEDYNRSLELSGVDGIMIGRGALIKPWIFQEIKEQRHIDVTANERLELIKKFCDFGLEHWGSDTWGVNLTRRYLMEWQSFHYRYVPYPILVNPPHRINQRPQPFNGRSDLETLLASPNCSDWLKLSEIYLGKAPEDFKFVPKHKASSF